MSSTPVARDLRFDLLRCIALFCIFLAHVGPPPVVAALRGFDVPLIVLVSGAVFTLSSSRKNLSYGQYVLKRILRLVMPVWIFLPFYFLISEIFALIMHVPFPFGFHEVFDAFTLQDGFAYVWILRILVGVALVAPFIDRLHQRLTKNSLFLLVLFLSYLVFTLIFSVWPFWEVVRYFPEMTLGNVVMHWIIFPIPYVCILGLGMCIPSMNRKQCITFASVFAILYFIGFFLYQHFQVPGIMDHIFWMDDARPPRPVFLSYSLAVSFALLALIGKQPRLSGVLRSIIDLVGRQSLWMYLWHIFYLSLLDRVMPPNLPFMKLGLLIVLTVFTVFVQETIIKRMEGSAAWCRPFLKYMA